MQNKVERSLFYTQLVLELDNLYREMDNIYKNRPSVLTRAFTALSQKTKIMLGAGIAKGVGGMVGGAVNAAPVPVPINGQAVGMIAGAATRLILQSYFDHQNAQNQKNIDNAKKILDKINSYGGFAKFKSDVADYLVRRFKFAIFELSNNHKAIVNLAEFFTAVIAENLLIGSVENKEELFKIVMPNKDSELYKAHLRRKRIGQNKWTFHGLCTRAPILTENGNLWIRSDKSMDRSEKYPHQFLEEKEVIALGGYDPLWESPAQDQAPLNQLSESDRQSYLKYFNEKKEIATPGCSLDDLRNGVRKKRRELYFKLADNEEKFKNGEEILGTVASVLQEYTELLLAFYCRLSIQDKLILDKSSLNFFKNEVDWIRANFETLSECQKKISDSPKTPASSIKGLFNGKPEVILSNIDNMLMDLNKLKRYYEATTHVHLQEAPEKLFVETDEEQLKIQKELLEIYLYLNKCSDQIEELSTLEKLLKDCLLKLYQDLRNSLENLLDVTHNEPKGLKQHAEQKNLIRQDIFDIIFMVKMLINSDNQNMTRLLQVLTDLPFNLTNCSMKEEDEVKENGKDNDIPDLSRDQIEDKYKNGEKVLVELLKIKEANFYFDQGVKAFQEKKYLSAINYATFACLRDPLNPNYYALRGDAEFANHEYKKAIEDYESSLLYCQAKPTNPQQFPEVHYRLALGLCNRAVLDYKKAGEVDALKGSLPANLEPTDAEEYAKAHGDAFQHLQSALYHCEQVIKLSRIIDLNKPLNFNLSHAHFLLGYCYEMLSYLRTYDSHLGQAKRNSDKTHWHAITGPAAKKRDEALNNYAEAIKISPENHFAFFKLENLAKHKSDSSSVRKYLSEMDFFANDKKPKLSEIMELKLKKLNESFANRKYEKTIIEEELVNDVELLPSKRLGFN